MPFTFAHPLYAAPLALLRPQYVSATGLILGSMSPDFEYFIWLEPYQSIGHTTKGLFLQAIPLCIVFAYLFHYIIKQALAENLPGYAQLDRRAQHLIRRWRLGSVQAWLVFIISVIIGFYSHVLIDGFTHASGLFVGKYHSLQQELFGIPLFKWLQHSLSMAGLALEAVWLWIMLRRRGSPPAIHGAQLHYKHKIRYWLIVLTTAVVTVLLKLMLTSSTNIIGILVVAFLSGLLLGVLLSSIIYRIGRARSGDIVVK